MTALGFVAMFVMLLVALFNIANDAGRQMRIKQASIPRRRAGGIGRGRSRR